MFCDNYNFILGERSSGRSQFLFSISKIFQEQCIKSVFYAGTDEFSDDKLILNLFKRSFFYRHGDHRITDCLIEYVKKESCEFLIIDDIDYFLEKDIFILENLNLPKICTCEVDKLPKLKSHFTKFLITNSKHDLDNQMISFSNTSIRCKDFLKSLDRDKKINLLLK